MYLKLWISAFLFHFVPETAEDRVADSLHVIHRWCSHSLAFNPRPLLRPPMPRPRLFYVPLHHPEIAASEAAHLLPNMQPPPKSGQEAFFSQALRFSRTPRFQGNRTFNEATPTPPKPIPGYFEP